MVVEIDFVESVQAWWREQSPPFGRTRPPRGTLAGALIILDNLRTNPALDVQAHTAANSQQLRGATGARLQSILSRFGENRVFLREGGRTNRGMLTRLESLLRHLSDIGFDGLTSEERETAIDSMQKFLIARVREYLNSRKISFRYDGKMTVRRMIGNILSVAGERGKSGEVAEYMVGAKLALRFPNLDIRNSSASASDEQVDERGDFQIHDSVFHVTVAPNRGHYEKCRLNLEEGYRVFLLVPDNRLAGTRQISETELDNAVAVESIESFVSQNIEEISTFSRDRLRDSMRSLIVRYNERLAEVETDLSLQIEMPGVLS